MDLVTGGKALFEGGPHLWLSLPPYLHQLRENGWTAVWHRQSLFNFKMWIYFRSKKYYLYVFETYVIALDDEESNLKLLDALERHLARNKLPQYDTVRPRVT